ncbi:MAG: hypothetical protein ACPG8F_08730 [Flavobacteriaceae bacterium]|jgi:hypothetical protein
MFSLYEGKINNKIPSKTIDFNTLITIVKTNPYKRDYKVIRTHKKGDIQYNQGKKELVRCHPNCVLKYNSISGPDFEKNYEIGSGYIYLDIDNLNNPIDFKKEFILKYKEVVSMVCLSSGGIGLSVLVKINHLITSKHEYKCIIDFLKSQYFRDVEFDSGSDKLSQMWFISHDPNVFVNTEVCIDVTEGLKCVDQGIIHRVVSNNTLFYALEKEIMYLSIADINSNLITRTKYNNKKDIDIETIPWTDIKIPRVIRDGSKRRIYTRLIHSLFHLNPEVEPKYVLGYIYNVNRNCADPKMSYRDLLSLFNMQYGYIKSDHYKYQNFRYKTIHISPDAKLTSSQKSIIANKINGCIRQNKTKSVIAAAINQLINDEKDYSVSSISKMTGVSRKTVGLYINNLDPIDIDALINQLTRDIK